MVDVLRVMVLVVNVAGMEAVVVVLREGCVQAIAIVRGRISGIHRGRERVKRRDMAVREVR